MGSFVELILPFPESALLCVLISKFPDMHSQRYMDICGVQRYCTVAILCE